MKNKYRTLLCAVLAVASTPLLGQDTLTLDAAIQQAMQGNHGIAVATNTVEISRNRATAGNAGLLPSVTLDGGGNYQNQNVNLELAGDNPPIEQDGAQTVAYNASIGASYTLEGFRTLYTFDQLKASSELAEVQSRLTIENSLIDVILTYYTAAGYQEQLEIAEESMAISRERYDRARLNFNYGNTSRLTVLNAQVDLNTDSANLFNARLNLENSKRDLFFLLGEEPKEMALSRSVVFSDGFELEALKTAARQDNASILVAAANLDVSQFDVKIAQSGRYPRISFSTSYGLNNSNTDAGIVTNNRTTGLSAGVTLSYNLFNGGQTNTAIKNAQVALANNQTRLNEAEQLVEKEVANGHASYTNSLDLLELEQVSVETARLNFDRSRDQYQRGQITATQFREAQLNLIQAQSRVNNARFNAKVAEMQLLRLIGALISGQ